MPLPSVLCTVQYSITKPRSTNHLTSRHLQFCGRSFGRWKTVDYQGGGGGGGGEWWGPFGRLLSKEYGGGCYPLLSLRRPPLFPGMKDGSPLSGLMGGDPLPPPPPAQIDSLCPTSRQPPATSARPPPVRCCHQTEEICNLS